MPPEPGLPPSRRQAQRRPPAAPSSPCRAKRRCVLGGTEKGMAGSPAADRLDSWPALTASGDCSSPDSPSGPGASTDTGGGPCSCAPLAARSRLRASPAAAAASAAGRKGEGLGAAASGLPTAALGKLLLLPSRATTLALLCRGMLLLLLSWLCTSGAARGRLAASASASAGRLASDASARSRAEPRLRRTLALACTQRRGNAGWRQTRRFWYGTRRLHLMHCRSSRLSYCPSMHRMQHGQAAAPASIPHLCLLLQAGIH